MFRWYIAAVVLLALGFADWAMVAFHASRTGLLGPAEVPLVYAGVMGLDALGALLFGALFDRFGLVVLAGTTLIGAAFAPLVFLSAAPLPFLVGAACWGLSMGAQDSIFKAAIAELVPKHERARAYGNFFALFGLAWWLGSSAMGWLYERSLTSLVVLSVVAQLASVVVLVAVARRLRDAH